MSKYPGRIISATPPTVSLSEASGVWTLEEAAQYQEAGTWPVAVPGIVADPNFKQTVLLLHGDGTNGAQNNTFLDGSTNNFTITRNPATGPNAPTQGTFSPFSLAAGEWSNYFDGSDSLTVPTGTFSYTSGTAFTVEFFVYRTSTTGSTTHAQIVVGTSGNTISVYINNSGAVIYGQANVADIITSATGVIQLNKWHHVAIGKNSSNQVRMWVDGSSVGTGTDTTNYATGSMYVGRNAANTQNLDGYISNLRSVTGSDVYGYGNSSITVPTTPLTNITNTSLLTCQSNRFVDNGTANSGTGFAITRNGDVRVTPFSPFAPSAAYDPAVNGGSGYFDGTGDYLSIADDAALDLASGDFTIEAWIYLPVAPAADDRLFKKWASTSGYMLFFQNNTGTLRFIYRGALGTGPDIQGAGVVIGQWNHVAVTRSTNTYNIWVNGASVANTTNTVAIADNALNLNIGGDDVLFEGYMSQARILKGTALYTSAFTPPTAPLTAITNTSLLCNFTNAGIFDNTGKNNLETVGDAQIDTTTKKFGTGSMEFDGTGDYLLGPGNPDIVFGTGNFTIEYWIYFNVTNVQQGVIGFRPNGTAGNYPVMYFLSGTLRYNVNGTDRMTASVSSGQWYHVAVARSGTDTKMFLDGTQVGSTFTDTTNYLAARIVIGADDFSLGGSSLNGFIDDLRITKGVARYPTEPFPTKAFLDQ